MFKKIVVGFIVLALVGWFFARSKSESIDVDAYTVESGLVEQRINNSRAGSVKACQRSKLSMPIGGRVAELLVDQGDHVEQGQVLLKLWNDDHKAGVMQSQAMLEAAELRQQEICIQAGFAKNEAKRQTELDKKNLTTQHTLEQAVSAEQTQAMACAQAKVMVKQAKATVDLQLAILSQTELTAPFAGVIAEINGEVGEFVTPSPPGVPTPPAVDLINPNCLYVTVPIDEIDASRLQLGQTARVTLDAFGDRNFDAKVTRIAPYVQELERQARTVDVDLQLQTPADDVLLLIGYSADAQIILEQRQNTIRVPTAAILDGNHVFTIGADNIAHLKTIELGLQNWTWTEVIAGLNTGDRIITSLDNPALIDGAVVGHVRQVQYD